MSVLFELRNPKATPCELLAMVPLALPKLLTQQKRALLLPSGERSHQLEAAGKL